LKLLTWVWLWVWLSITRLAHCQVSVWLSHWLTRSATWVRRLRVRVSVTLPVVCLSQCLTPSLSESFSSQSLATQHSHWLSLTQVADRVSHWMAGLVIDSLSQSVTLTLSVTRLCQWLTCHCWTITGELPTHWLTVTLSGSRYRGQYNQSFNLTKRMTLRVRVTVRPTASGRDAVKMCN